MILTETFVLPGVQTPKRFRQKAFTLVEMLVVIAIIGILAAILIPTVARAIVRARENVIAQEISQLHQAVEAYKQKFGDYPPDFSSVTVAADLTNPGNVVTRHFRKAFPKHIENLPVLFTNAAGTFNVPDESEALVFWLSALKNDVRQPISGTGDRYILFPFEENRLQDLDGDGFMSYVHKGGTPAPYVYFDSRTYAIARMAHPTVSGDLAAPYQGSVTNATTQASNPAPGNQWVNATTFQILSAGLDGEYGKDILTVAPNLFKIFPTDTTITTSLPAANFESGDHDNISNFSDGKTFRDILP